MDERHVVVIGGGITGLSAAYRLIKLGLDRDIKFTLFESDIRLGGKIDTLETDDYRLELGPDSIYTRKSGALELIEELGLTSDIVPVSPSAGTLLWHNGSLRTLPAGFHSGVPSNLTSLRETDVLSIAGKTQALEDIVLPYHSYDEDVSLGHLLRERLGDELTDVIAAPLLAGIHAGDIDQMSTEANMPILLKWYREHQSLILGALESQRKLSIQLNPNQSPNSNAKPQPMFVSLKRGLAQLVEALAQQVGESVDVQLATQVVSLKATQHGQYELTVVQRNKTRTVLADGVIVATPANIAGNLLSDIADKNLLSTIRYASTATVSFGYDKAPAMLKTSGFLVPRSEGTMITACTIVSHKWVHSSKTGKFLVRCYVGYDGSEAFTNLDDAALAEAVRGDLQTILHFDQIPDFITIKRWNHSMPQYDIGHLAKVEAIESQLELARGIVLAGSAYRGVGIPDCITDGGRAARQLGLYLSHLRNTSTIKA